MSIQNVTLVDVDEGLWLSRWDRTTACPGRMTLDMQSIAAYYVIVANDLARDSQKPRYRVVAARPTLSARIGTALTALARPVRRTSQPA